ncbi:MAG: hypothetical protein IPP83_16485 [Flavobacteriales bacterium]|nr:hypothetical protein [Flavobacteriales bacterium]
MRPILVLFVLLSACTTHAQTTPHLDRIILMNGEVVETRVLGQSTLEIRHLELGRNGRTKERAEPTEGVFSVIDTLGHERIWYFHDTIFGNELTIDQMRCFIKGEQDARAGYRSPWTMWGGFIFGAGTTIAADLEVNSLFLPPLFAGVMILPRVFVSRGSLTDPVMEGNEHYAYGYAKVGRTRRVVRSLISTAAGVAVGLGVRQFLINPNLKGYN